MPASINGDGLFFYLKKFLKSKTRGPIIKLMGITSNGRVTNDIQTAIEKRFEIHENQGQSWFFFFAHGHAPSEKDL